MDIVCLALPKWYGEYISSTVELMKQISQRNRVLYIDYHRTIKDVIYEVFRSEILRVLGIKNRHIIDGNAIVWYLPPILSINWVSNKFIYYQLAKINGWIIGSSISKALVKFNFHEYHLINAFSPIYGMTTRRFLNPISVTYYCYDEISAAKWCKSHGQWTERLLMKKVNKVVVTSTGLLDSKLSYNSNTFLLRNGVDFDTLNKYFNSERFINEDKIIGYIGAIDDRLDYTLLEFLIKNLSECEFWFIGRILDKRAEKLRLYSNVKLLGSFEKQKLALMVNKFHIGLIPFIKNDFTENIYPLKVNEYLAAGCSVISTDFADLSDLKDQIFISTDHNSFLKFCKKALLEHDSNFAINRNKFAARNSWNNKAQEFIKIISS